jgi:hypothetical protein
MKIKTEAVVNVAGTVSLSETAFNDIPDFEPTIGWFSNKYNAAGWLVTDLDNGEIDWLASEGISYNEIATIKRTITDGGRTSLCKFDLVKGTYAFLDNEVLNETGEIKFDRKTYFRRFKVENSQLALETFGIEL